MRLFLRCLLPQLIFCFSDKENMPTLLFSPKELDTPDRLDRWLAMGWRTTGQSIYNCNFLTLNDGTLVSVLPCRLPLKGYTFSKRLRKLLRKNASYRVKIGPATMGPAEKQLNEAYKIWRPDRSIPDLLYHLYSFEHKDFVLNTGEVAVFDQNRLIAFSYFDQGAKAVYGKTAVYEPALAANSLGLYTMLLEVAHCQRMNFDWYYPGYVSDDTPLFDYKHRIGALEFYDIFSQQWLPYGQFPALQKPLDVLLAKLEELAVQIRISPYTPKLYTYTNFDERYNTKGHSSFLDTPLFIYLEQLGEAEHLIVYFNIDSNSYDLVRVTSSIYYTNGSAWRHLPRYTSLLKIENRFCSSPDIAGLQRALRHLKG